MAPIMTDEQLKKSLKDMGLSFVWHETHGETLLIIALEPKIRYERWSKGSTWRTRSRKQITPQQVLIEAGLLTHQQRAGI